MNHPNRRLTPRSAEDARLQAAIDRGVAHLRASHTLGPWSVGRMLNPANAPAIIGDEDSVVAILPGEWNGCSYIKADALVLAAAPELLFHLQTLVALFEDSGMYDDEVFTGARKTIAKATTPADESVAVVIAAMVRA